MSGDIAREITEAETWQSIQAQPYDGERYPCGCHPHPVVHRRFYLCDYHDGFDAGVDRGRHELRAEIKRLRAAGDALVGALENSLMATAVVLVNQWKEISHEQ